MPPCLCCGHFTWEGNRRKSPTLFVRIVQRKVVKARKEAKSKYVFFLFLCLGHSRFFWGGKTQVLDGKLCENDEFGTRLDLGRSNHYKFRSFQKKIGQNKKILSISIQTEAKVYEYVRLRQCNCANVIEQTFAVILHREATTANRRLCFLGPFKEK
jgi:hypothetical protein